MLHDKSNKKILEELNELVYGHDLAKKSLISLVNRSKLRHYQKWGELLPNEALLKPSKCLLIGGSGTGKTHLVQTLSNIAHFPLLIVDATAFNPTGASGGIKPDKLRTLIIAKAREYAEMHGDKDTYFSIDGVIDQMVVFVDEFDKLSSHYGSGSGSWNEHLQTHFLTLFENHSDLDGVSWIFAGAFSGIDKEKYKKKNIGFNYISENDTDAEDVSDEDVVKYGMIPEIVGRLTSICRLDKLTEQDFYNILIELVVPKKVMELSYFGISDIDLTEEQLRSIAKRATESSQGVRYLYREIEKHFLDVEFNYEENTI